MKNGKFKVGDFCAYHVQYKKGEEPKKKDPKFYYRIGKCVDVSSETDEVKLHYYHRTSGNVFRPWSGADAIQAISTAAIMLVFMRLTEKGRLKASLKRSIESMVGHWDSELKIAEDDADGTDDEAVEKKTRKRKNPEKVAASDSDYVDAPTPRPRGRPKKRGRGRPRRTAQRIAVYSDSE